MQGMIILELQFFSDSDHLSFILLFAPWNADVINDP
jgi:hypothetical protein